MKERPILFSAPMVRALLDGTKTQTRRLVTVPWKGSRRALPYSPYWGDDRDDRLTFSDEAGDEHPAMDVLGRPYGDFGDRLWVRETFAVPPGSDARSDVAYRADLSDAQRAEEDEARRLAPKLASEHPWKPSIYMPRWASRITLEVTGVRVERLQAITDDDARAEGVEPAVHQESWTAYDPVSQSYPTFFAPPDPSKYESIRYHPPQQFASAREQFQRLWDSINGKRAPWSSNPWVWVIAFRRIEARS